MDQDFIVTGLLSELKAENIRKDAVIRGLIKVICGVVAAVLVVVAGFLLYLNQYDFGSTTTTNATGVYTLVDSQGNVVATDLTADEIKERLSEKGAKCNLQFSTREREFYEREAGFTDEEIEIFRMRSRGFSVIKISQEMSVRHDKYYSLSTIEGRIRSIKDKILRIL